MTVPPTSARITSLAHGAGTSYGPGSVKDSELMAAAGDQPGEHAGPRSDPEVRRSCARLWYLTYVSYRNLGHLTHKGGDRGNSIVCSCAQTRTHAPAARRPTTPPHERLI